MGVTLYVDVAPSRNMDIKANTRQELIHTTTEEIHPCQSPAAIEDNILIIHSTLFTTYLAPAAVSQTSPNPGLQRLA